MDIFKEIVPNHKLIVVNLNSSKKYREELKLFVPLSASNSKIKRIAVAHRRLNGDYIGRYDTGHSNDSGYAAAVRHFIIELDAYGIAAINMADFRKASTAKSL